MPRRRSGNDYVGCLLTSHRGKLRLQWRMPDPDRSGGRRRRHTWNTGEADSPAARLEWEWVLRLVAELRDRGE